MKRIYGDGGHSAVLHTLPLFARSLNSGFALALRAGLPAPMPLRGEAHPAESQPLNSIAVGWLPHPTATSCVPAQR